MRIAMAQIDPIVGSLKFNRNKIVDFIQKARKKNVNILIFPELALCGYPPEDLLYLPSFVTAVQEELEEIKKTTQGITVIVGTVRENPFRGEKRLYNSAAIFQDGELVGFQDKTLLPDYDVFSERRYFEPAGRCDIWSLSGKKVAITICEDMWQHAGGVGYTSYNKDPVQNLAAGKPDLFINISSSPYHFMRVENRLELCKKVAYTLRCPVLYCNQVGGNDSLVFDGYSLYVNAKGELLARGKSFEEDFVLIDTSAKMEPLAFHPDPIEDLYKALVLGVKDYFGKLGFKKACFGLSGGIDSAVVACIAVEALGKKNLFALGLPSRYSSEEGIRDAKQLAKKLEIEFKQVSIEGPFQNFLALLETEFKSKPAPITEENLQARIRAVILMAYSNNFNYLLLSTGNKSEMALGYTTLYGDMSGGLAVLSDVTKAQVYALADFINRREEIIPLSIIARPPSAELRYDQKDTDTLPEYPIVDTIIASYIEEHHSPEEIATEHKLPLPLVKDLIRKIHLNEYKRRQAPPGLRVTKRAFTTGRRFPIVQHWNVK